MAGVALANENNEVAEARWFTPKELRKFFEDNPDKFVLSARIWMPIMLDQHL